MKMARRMAVQSNEEIEVSVRRLLAGTAELTDRRFGDEEVDIREQLCYL